MVSTIIRKFIATEASSGFFLIFFAMLAMIAANSPLQEYYNTVFSHSVQFWINDGLMVLFFFLIGMEIKRELYQGELSSFSQALLPTSAAIGGMVFPAIIYATFNWHDATALHGWAAGSATDIAFSLCILSLCGSRIPSSLKVFLMAVAVIDDLGAILIIALFYTPALSSVWLLLAAIALVGLWWLNHKKNQSSLWYIMFGVILWVAVLNSGIHATIAGVLLGVMIPLEPKYPSSKSMLVKFEHALHPYVSYGILPIFAFANAGISLADISWHDVGSPITLGIALGLFVGKQCGVLCFAGLLIVTGLARKPSTANWKQLYGVALLAGIGFTMSLFIGGLAFTNDIQFINAKLGIIIGSLLSALTGYLVLRMTNGLNRQQS